MDTETAKELQARLASDYAADPITRNPRVDAAILEAANPQSGDSALDLMTGTGFYALELARRAAPGEVLGLDLSPETLESAVDAANRARLTNLHFQEAPAGIIPDTVGGLDLVTCIQALHRISNPRVLMTRIREVLRPGGRFIVSDLCGKEDSLLNHALIKLIQSRFDPTCQWLFNRAEIRSLLKKAGLIEIKIGWMPKLSYTGIHLAEMLLEAKGNPDKLKQRMEGHLFETEQNALLDFVQKTPQFEAEKILGVFIATGKRPEGRTQDI